MTRDDRTIIFQIKIFEKYHAMLIVFFLNKYFVVVTCFLFHVAYDQNSVMMFLFFI